MYQLTEKTPDPGFLLIVFNEKNATNVSFFELKQLLILKQQFTQKAVKLQNLLAC